MADLITKAEAFNHLRFDTAPGGPDDLWLDTWIPIVSAAVLSWLKDDWRPYVLQRDGSGNLVIDSGGDPIPFVDSDGDMEPLALVKGAVLIELSSMNRFREGEGTENMVPPEAGWGYILNKASTALLASIRMSTVA